MTSHTVTSAAPETGSSGTRQPAFLRPLPGERRDGPNGEGPAAGPPGADELVLARLFPPAPIPVESDLTPGDVAGVRLGHFVIEERIGRGGMGAVFRAVDERLNRIVALKVLSPAHSRDPAAADRFRNEAQAAARLDHENIARVYYIGEDKGVPFIAFEFVRGTNVRDFILQKGMLSPAEAVNYALQIALALRHTQAARVVHRDIKPSNIIITPAGHAKLVDLGLARQEQAEEAPELTVPGTTLGTFDYIAPEQARDPRCVDVRADIYSLGCTLYHMLTGEPPFPQGTIIQKVVDHHRDAPPDPADRNPQVPEQLSQVVRRMMATNPDDRYPGPDPLIHDLSQVAAALGLRPTHPENLVWVHPLYEPRPDFLSHNKGWLLTLAALLLIAAAIHRLPSEWLTATDELGRASHTAADDRSTTAPQPPRPTAAGLDLLAPPAPEPRQPSGMASGVSGLNEMHRASTLEALLGAVDGQAASPAAQPPLPPRDAAASSRPSRDLADTAVDRAIEAVTSPIPRDLAPPMGGGIESALPPAAPFVVIDALHRTEQAFDSLETACQQAPNDAWIELRFDGVLPRPQPPIRIQNKRLTIRGQAGKRPVIQFQSAPVFGRDDLTQMIQVAGGSLKLYDVGLVMPVTAVPAERWALFSLVQAEELELRGVSIVVTNPRGQPATVVEIVPPPSLDPQAMMPDSMMRRQVALDFQDCLFRGDCDLLLVQTLDATEVRLDNLAVALRGTLARVHGQELSEGRVSDDRRLALRLRHVTALLAEGLLRVDTGFEREFATVDVSCEDSAVSVRPGQALLSMSAHQDLGTLQRRLRWQSSWSAFDVTGPVWEIVQELDGRREERDFMALGISSSQIIDNALLAEPLRWSEVQLSSLTEQQFTLNTAAPQATRNGLTGVQFGGRLPPANAIPPSAPRGSEGAQ